MRVGIGELDLHRTRHRSPTSPHFGERILEAGAGLGVLTAENAQQRAALRFGRTLVDDDRRFALAFMDCSGPAKNADKTQTVERRPAVRRDRMVCRRLSIVVDGLLAGRPSVTPRTTNRPLRASMSTYCSALCC